MRELIEELAGTMTRGASIPPEELRRIAALLGVDPDSQKAYGLWVLHFVTTLQGILTAAAEGETLVQVRMRKGSLCVLTHQQQADDWQVQHERAIRQQNRALAEGEAVDEGQLTPATLTAHTRALGFARWCKDTRARGRMGFSGAPRRLGTDKAE